ncbi:MAG: alkaline phosphatase family protein, partial [Terriglobia bacterium]
MSQPGVAPIMNYLNSLSYAPFRGGDCAPNAYYLLNNYNPGYNADGTINTSTFTVPPSTVPTIADQLTSRGISWRYYGEGWNSANPNSVYCNICNPFQYSTAVMTSASGRAHIQDVTQLYTDVANGWLPSVAYIKPDGYLDGHPASSKIELFEGFVQKIVDRVKADPELWKSTAIFITVDEGGGYYDSGYVQPIDFFGDGTRIPLIVVSPYSEGGRVVHTCADHVSVLKFIERNWDLHPVSDRSRDNLPNPVATPDNPYVPTNGPAIGDLMSMFNFHSGDRDHDHDHDHGNQN